MSNEISNIVKEGWPSFFIRVKITMTPIEIVDKHFGADALTEAQKIEIRDISDELANIIIRNYCSRSTRTHGDK